MRRYSLFFLFIGCFIISACSNGGGAPEIISPGGSNAPGTGGGTGGNPGGGPGGGPVAALVSVGGKVTQESGLAYSQPVSGVTICLEPGGRTVLTGSDGTWQAEVPAGTYTVSANHAGVSSLTPAQAEVVAEKNPVTGIDFVELILPSTSPFVYVGKSIKNPSLTALKMVLPGSLPTAKYDDEDVYPIHLTPVRRDLVSAVFTVGTTRYGTDRDAGVWLLNWQTGAATYPVPASGVPIISSAEKFPAIPDGPADAVRAPDGTLYVAISSPCDLNYCKDVAGVHQDRNEILAFIGDGSLYYLRVTYGGINILPNLGNIDLATGYLPVFWLKLSDKGSTTGDIWMQVINLWGSPDLIGSPVKIVEGVQNHDHPLSISPDGKRIVFVRFFPEDGTLHLVVKDIDFSASETDLGQGWGPYWAQDGRIWFTDQGIRFSMRPDGTGKENVGCPSDIQVSCGYVFPVVL